MPRCKEETESDHHVLFTCSFAAKVLRSSYSSHLSIEFSHPHPNSLPSTQIQWVVELIPYEASLFDFILWSIWTSRNNTHFRGRINSILKYFLLPKVYTPKSILSQRWSFVRRDKPLHPK